MYLAIFARYPVSLAHKGVLIMSLRRKLKNNDAVRYCNAESEIHVKRVAERKARSAVEWIPVVKEDVSGGAETTFGLDWKKAGLPRGQCFRFEQSGFEEVEGAAFETYLSNLRRDRSWVVQVRCKNGDPMVRKDGELCTYRRQRPNSIVEVVVNLSPAQALWLRGRAAAAIKKKLEHCLNAVGDETISAIDWDLLCASIHYDSARPHLNLYVSRVLADHTLAAPARLCTIGSWSVGQWRLSKIGAGGDGNAVLMENLRRFRERHGPEAEPFDLRLHRRFDEAFEEEGDGGDGQDDLDGVELRRCEGVHREWKRLQPTKIIANKRHCDAVLVTVLRALRPFLPPVLGRALSLITQVSEVISVIENFIASRPEKHIGVPAPTVAPNIKDPAAELYPNRL